MKAILGAAALAAMLPGSGPAPVAGSDIFALCRDSYTGTQARLAACAAAVIGRPDDAALRYAYGYALRQAGKDAEAADAFERAAKAGDPRAEAALGAVYLRGLGRAPDRAAALAWYRKAARAGNARAQAVLGFLYYAADGTASRPRLAAKWLGRAAMQGQTEAQLGLGTLYARGIGVAPDAVEAHMLFSLAAAKLPRGPERAMALGWRGKMAKRMTLDQIDEAKRLAGDWRAFER